MARFLPSLIEPGELPGTCVVMTDVLRASTTIIQALAAAQLRCIHKQKLRMLNGLLPNLATAHCWVASGGVIINGFHCGNSPREFTPEIVAGRNLVLCTSNGTYTLDFCRNADRILIGAFVNLSLVCDELSKHSQCVIACTGTDRQVTGEDILFAGAVADRLSHRYPNLVLDDSSLIARDYWRSVENRIGAGTTSLWEVFANSSAGGRNLMKLNYQADIQFCAQIDLTPIVPELDSSGWTITLP